jgi:hypothetical protein
METTGSPGRRGLGAFAGAEAKAARSRNRVAKRIMAVRDEEVDVIDAPALTVDEENARRVTGCSTA